MLRSHYGILAAVSATLAGALIATANPAKPEANHDERLAALMYAKLASSQKVVAGLVSEDLDAIARGAKELNSICDAAEWPAHGDQVYSHHRTELKRLSFKMAEMAEKKNLDGAAFTYMHSLSICISCHQHCRDVLHIAGDAPILDQVVPIPVTTDNPARLDEGPVRR